MSSQIDCHTAPAQIYAFVECPNCGRIPKPTGNAIVLLGTEGPDEVHCRFHCERCGTDKAILHLKRELFARH